MKMNSQKINSKKSAALSHRQIVLILLGVTVCYQMIYQGIMWRALQNEEAAADEACAATGLSDPIAGQPARCLEMHLFQNWQQEGSYLKKAQLSELRRGGEELLHFEPSLKVVTTTKEAMYRAVQASLNNATAYPASVNDSKSHFDKADKNTDGILDLEELVAARSQMGHKDPVADAHRVIGLWDENHDGKITLEEFLDYTRPHWRDQAGATTLPQSSPRATVLSHAQPTTMSPEPTVTHQDETMSVTVAPAAALHHFGEIDKEADVTKRSRWTPMTEWAANLVGLQRSMQARSEELARKHRLQATLRAEERAKWRQEEFDRLEKEVLESLNRSRTTISPWAKDLMATQKRLEEKLRHLNSTRAHKRGDPLASTTKALPTLAPRLRGQSKSLSWPAVHAWRQNKAKRAAVVAGWEELRGARWSGMIPKVSCIAVIPSGKAAKIRMAHFIDNFRLQEYEGLQQLVLVYHHDDEEAQKLVSRYADGSYIKGTAAFGERDLPSTVAFRYGAWVSDGDVVARWDFEQFHHPWRLSLQVRALALTGRPASFFRHPAVQKEEEPDIVASSLVGERAWMHEHWHPLLSVESTSLQSAHAGQMVEVDVLALRKSARPLSETQTFTTLPSECFGSGLDAEMHADSPQQLQKAIAEKLGSEMGDTYRSLQAKRAEVKDKLMALCAEEAESVGGDDAERRQQLRRLVVARAGMDEHFAALSALFEEAA